MEFLAFFDDCADGDIKIQFVAVDVSDVAGVDSAGGGFELVDDLHGAVFGTTGDGAAREG